MITEERQRPNGWMALFILLLLLLALIITVITGCKTTREITRTEIKTDSIALKQRDSLRVQITQQRQRYEKQISDLKKTQVKFEKTPCPPAIINIDSACSKDSMVKIIQQQAAFIAAQKNKITVLSDGTIQYEGLIKNIRSENNHLEMAATEIWKQYSDSLSVWQNERMQLLKEKTELTKNVKKNFLFSWWIWYLAGAVSMLVLIIFLNIRYGKNKS
jgi:hypothetical protein